MKSSSLVLRASAWLALGFSASMTHAATPLFKVTIATNPAYPLAQMITVEPKINRHYPYAGIKITDPNYAGRISRIEGCTMTRNGWCVFSVGGGNNKRKKLSIRLHSPVPRANNILYPLPMPGSLTSSTTTVQTSTNASGSDAVSVQSVSATSPGKLIGYIYGSETPVPASDIAQAGYTHVLINAAPFYDGTITGTGGTLYMNALTGFSDFNSSQTTSLYSYIQQLHSYSIYVLLSIGGTIYGTYPSGVTPYFSTAVDGVSNPQTFINDLIGNSTTPNTLTYIADTYGFDGFDFNIEGGLGTNTSSSSASENFTNPGANCSLSTYSYDCTTYYLYTLINTIYSSLYSAYGNQLLLSIPPQYSQAGANSQYDSVYTTFSAIAMQVYYSLAWFAPQLYNPGSGGSIYGINTVIYPLSGQTFTSTTDTGVALGVDVLASWPQNTSVGFFPYIADLTQSQVAMGYAINESTGDGSPVAIPSVVQNTVACLRYNTCCTSYIPPSAYSSFAGVFAFTINGDQANNFSFANTISECVVYGDCPCLS